MTMVHEEQDKHEKGDRPEKGEQGSPGALLRAGREKAGLSVEQVAEKLHLLQSVVNSLEKDCYDRIRGDTFVRGYMRNYARLVGIDGDEVVGRYNTRSGGARSESRFSRRREGWHGSGGAGRVSVVAALAVASAMLVLWNRAPKAEAAVPAPAPGKSLSIETARGAQLLDLEAPAGQ